MGDLEVLQSFLQGRVRVIVGDITAQKGLTPSRAGPIQLCWAEAVWTQPYATPEGRRPARSAGNKRSAYPEGPHPSTPNPYVLTGGQTPAVNGLPAPRLLFGGVHVCALRAHRWSATGSGQKGTDAPPVE